MTDEQGNKTKDSSGLATSFAGNLVSKRKEILSQIVGPLQLLALILMTCEASLAYTTTVVDDSILRWFLSSSMVLILGGTISGFFYMMINHHEKLYPPPLYSEQIQEKVFARKKQNPLIEINSSIIENYIIQLLSNTNGSLSLNDIITFTAMHFDCRESLVRQLSFDMNEKGIIELQGSTDPVSGPLAILKNNSKEDS